ncbi:MAG: Primosomal protein N' (Replication factor Y)-superfamily II helicase [uncultured Sulfurovum sp.]|uniref:Primosomal protein N' (Replication factor Y)-superfamily II helicase n=1 Tax=uncultured Sulfurovum sp. TaxID=269237 RepID=A0A6S6S8T5_9BACT|nr:MAG: Primosomal protein N' (Replication factor Y)-superfamily II helicase [uncultured Sulfurovum sp.]
MKFTAINFTCPSCGAPQKFSPLTGKLKCEFCSKEVAIELSKEIIHEYDFSSAISTLHDHKNRTIDKQVHCKKCGGDFTLTPFSFSSNCPYCQTPAIVDFVREITPKSILPFRYTHKEAQHLFTKWVGSRWFAPNAFKKYTQGHDKLVGYYLPHWTYDSDTNSQYSGLRGDIYYVTVTKTVMENGRQRRIQVQEPRINWTPVSGVVHVSFDDVTVGASQTISRTILDSIEPWDTTKLVPFDEKYLLGFEAEEYTIGLDNGFEYAKAKMAYKIEKNIRYDIGGNQQQIHHIDTKHNNVTYKNVLFPVWTASFIFKEKEYHYAINAQTGKVVGQRPYSYTKIFFALLTVASIVGGLMYVEEKGYLDKYFQTSSHYYIPH